MKHLSVLLQAYGFRALNLFMLIAMCALAAKWTWVFLTPEPRPVLIGTDSPAVMQPAETILGSHLFSHKIIINQPPPNLKLEGVFALENGAGGAAIFQDSSGKSIMVQSAAQILPGLRLDAIYKDHVVLDRDGAKMRLNLEEKSPPLILN